MALLQYDCKKGGSKIDVAQSAGSAISGCVSVTADVGVSKKQALFALEAIRQAIVQTSWQASSGGPLPVITTPAVITSAPAGATITYTNAASTSTPAPTIALSLLKNGTTVATGAGAIAVYTSTVAGDSLVVRAVPTNANGTGVNSDSAAFVVTAAAGVPVTITTQLDALRVIQRTATTGGGQGKGQGAVAMALSFTGTQPIYCRRRSAADGTTIVQAPWQANASANTGSVTLSGIDAPAFSSSGAPVAAQDGWFYLDVATSSAGPWTNATNQINVGRIVGIAGQSLGTRFLRRQAGTDTNATLGVTVNQYCPVLATYNNDTINYMPTVSTMPWALPVDGGNYDGTGVSEFLRLQCLTFGVATAVMGHASSGVASGTFWSGSANATQFQNVTAKGGGAWEAQIWHQGHTEAGYGMPPNAYQGSLTAVFSMITAANSFAGYAKHLASIPNITTGAIWGTPYFRNRIRLAVAAWCAANSARHVSFNDLDQSDGVHQSQIGNLVLARHWHRSTRTELSLRGDAGPALVSATRVGTTIMAVFSDVGQGNLVLTGTPANRVFVFPQNNYDAYGTVNNRFPVSTVTVTNKTTLSIVLANDPGDGNVLDLRLYWPNDYAGTPKTDLIKDDLTDSDGIAGGRQVVPTFAPITVAAPVPASTINAAPVVAANASQFVMTGTGAAYGAQEQTGFNNTLNAGSAAAGANKTPMFIASTIECWFTCPTIGALSVIVGQGAGANYLGVSAAGKLTTNAVTGATTLVAGKRYHAALCQGPNGTQLYLTNVTDAIAGVRDGNSATPVSFSPTTATLQLRINNGSFAMTAGAVDEVSMWDAVKYTGASYTAPTAPYVGTETDLVALYHLDGDLTEKVAA